MRDAIPLLCWNIEWEVYIARREGKSTNDDLVAGCKASKESVTKLSVRVSKIVLGREIMVEWMQKSCKHQWRYLMCVHDVRRAING